MRQPCFVVFVWMLAWSSLAIAEPRTHQHPSQDVPLHEKFYSTWYMPDNPQKSCCNKADCYPTVVRFEDDKIYARRREDGKFILVP